MYIPVTINEQIEYGIKPDINHRTLNSRLFIHDQKSDQYLKMTYNPLYSKYKDYFDKWIVSVPLNEEQQIKYRYSPKKLSLDWYHTIDYWALILYINDCHSLINFTPEKVNLVYNDKIQDLINELMILDSR